MPAITNAVDFPLDRKGAQQFWESANPALLRLLGEMESRETWVLSEEEAFRVVEGLEAVLPSLNESQFADSLDAPGKAAILATLVGYVSATQFVAFLMRSETIRQGITQRLAYALRTAENDSQGSGVFAELFYERLQLVLSSDLKNQAFSGRRVAEIEAVIQEVVKMKDVSNASSL